MNLVVIFIILVVILAIIFKSIFKLASIFKVLGIALIVSAIIFSVIIYIMYINDVDYELLGIGNKYITGEIVSNNKGKIKIRVIDHNLDDNIKRNQTIAVKITNETAIRLQSMVLIEEKKEISDIKVGNKVNILCDKGESSEIIAKKVVIK